MHISTMINATKTMSKQPTSMKGALTLERATTLPRPVTVMTPRALMAWLMPFMISLVGAISRLLSKLYTTIVWQKVPVVIAKRDM